jgi:hypothetical protein
MADQPPAGPAGPVGEAATGVLSVEEAWRKFMIRIGTTNPKLITQGAAALDAVDAIIRRG